jgi:molybdopterin-biosynthesis enzyme MoeA-like protein
MKRFDWVVTTGGIGATHDDLTKQIVSRIVGKPLAVAPEAVRALEARVGSPLPEKILELAMVPEGAELVTNQRTAAPGFIVGNLLVLPGIPSLVESMIGILGSKLRGRAFHTSEIRTMCRESEVAHDLEEVQAHYPSVKVGSYPEMEASDHKVRIVLRSRDQVSLGEAREMLLERIVK